MITRVVGTGALAGFVTAGSARELKPGGAGVTGLFACVYAPSGEGTDGERNVPLDGLLP